MMTAGMVSIFLRGFLSAVGNDAKVHVAPTVYCI